ncbi:Protein of unknown function [Gryllus bimaculatus]|nr:Protein of unknown function [Gryllus bimaculatus]
MIKWKTIEQLEEQQITIIDSLNENLKTIEAYMIKNNPVSVKEAMSKARANIEALRYRWQNALEEKIEFQKTMQSLVKREEHSIEKSQYPPWAQSKKREAPSSPKEVRRGKKRKQGCGRVNRCQL